MRSVEAIKIKQAVTRLFEPWTCWRESNKKDKVYPTHHIESCVKCSSTGRLVRHHITYAPCKTARLCSVCHSRITAINTIGAIVTNTTKKNPDVNNEVRLILWDWFLSQNGSVTRKMIATVLGKDYVFTVSQIHTIEQARLQILNYKASKQKEE